MRVLATSRSYIYIPIDPPDDIPDVTVYVPEAALIPDDGTEPLDGDWHPATWINGKAALLIGPGSPLDGEYKPGDYYAFARITAGAEMVVLPSGRVRIGMLRHQARRVAGVPLGLPQPVVHVGPHVPGQRRQPLGRPLGPRRYLIHVVPLPPVRPQRRRGPRRLVAGSLVAPAVSGAQVGQGVGSALAELDVVVHRRAHGSTSGSAGSIARPSGCRHAGIRQVHPSRVSTFRRFAGVSAIPTVY